MFNTPYPLPEWRTNNLRTVYRQVSQGYLEVRLLTGKITFPGSREWDLLSIQQTAGWEDTNDPRLFPAYAGLGKDVCDKREEF